MNAYDDSSSGENIEDIVKSDVTEVQKHLINHIKLCNVSIEKVVDQLENTNSKLEKIVMVTEENTKAIGLLKEETQDIVGLYKDIRGATRIGVGIQKFSSWVIKWPLVGGGIYFVYDRVIKFFFD